MYILYRPIKTRLQTSDAQKLSSIAHCFIESLILFAGNVTLIALLHCSKAESKSHEQHHCIPNNVANSLQESRVANHMNDYYRPKL